MARRIPNLVRRILIVDGYAEASTASFRKAKMPTGAEVYMAALTNQTPKHAKLEFTTTQPASDNYTDLTDDELASFDGVAFTGSSMSAFDQDEGVIRQVDLMRRTFDCGVTSFGSCWAMQIAAVALGGTVELNPKGREVGVGRDIMMTTEGRSHPMYVGKKTVFSAFQSHSDEVTRIPATALVLATNEHSRVQAMSVVCNGIESWFVQYHPEYNLNYFAQLIALRTERMTRMGFFQNEAACLDYCAELTELHADPSRKDVAWKYGIPADMTDPDIKECELRNWVQKIVLQP